MDDNYLGTDFSKMQKRIRLVHCMRVEPVNGPALHPLKVPEEGFIIPSVMEELPRQRLTAERADSHGFPQIPTTLSFCPTSLYIYICV